MARNPKPYKRLPGRGSSSNLFAPTVITLWTGSDHLVLVEATRYTENYKRFYYRDIQALLIRRNAKRQAYNVVAGTIAAMIILWSAVIGGTEAYAIGAIIASPILLIMLINTILGPTCVCHLRTAVQTSLLPTLRRVRTAEKAFRKLRPLIQEAQGVLEPERLAQIEYDDDAVRKAIAASLPERLPASMLLFHQLFFGLLSVLGLSFSLALVIPPTPYFAAAACLIFLTTVICGIAALVRQHNALKDGVLKGLTGVAAGFIGICGGVAYFRFIFLTVAKPGAPPNEFQLVVQTFTLPQGGSPTILLLFLALILLALCLGGAGLIRTRRMISQSSSGPDAAPGEVS